MSNEKTFAAIDKLKEVEAELHRLKNALEMANRALAAKRKPLTNGEIYTAYITATNQTLRAQDERLAFAFAREIEAAHGIKQEEA